VNTGAGGLVGVSPPEVTTGVRPHVKQMTGPPPPETDADVTDEVG
jgi:hypothetical protein